MNGTRNPWTAWSRIRRGTMAPTPGTYCGLSSKSSTIGLDCQKIISQARLHSIKWFMIVSLSLVPHIRLRLYLYYNFNSRITSLSIEKVYNLRTLRGIIFAHSRKVNRKELYIVLLFLILLFFSNINKSKKKKKNF